MITDDLLRNAAQRYVEMSPIDKAFHHAEQRRSWIYGMTGRYPEPDHVDVLVAEVIRLRALLDK